MAGVARFDDPVLWQIVGIRLEIKRDHLEGRELLRLESHRGHTGFCFSRFIYINFV